MYNGDAYGMEKSDKNIIYRPYAAVLLTQNCPGCIGYLMHTVWSNQTKILFIDRMPQFCLRKTVRVVSDYNVYGMEKSDKNIIYRPYAPVLHCKTARAVSMI